MNVGFCDELLRAGGEIHGQGAEYIRFDRVQIFLSKQGIDGFSSKIFASWWPFEVLQKMFLPCKVL